MEKRITLIDNVRGYTFQQDQLRTFSALAFQGDTILDTANNAVKLQNEYSIDHYIDGEQCTLLPGLIDAHGHILELGYSRLHVDLSDARSLEEVQRLLKQYVRKHPDQEWIKGFGWDQSQWKQDRFPSSKIIDQAISDRPVWLVRKDSHAGWANSEALRRSNIGKSTPEPERGEIKRDNDGNPTGVLIDEAMAMVRRQLPTNKKYKNRQALEEALKQFSALGLTGVHEACMEPDSYEVFKEAVQNGELTTRIYAMINGESDFYDRWLEHGPASETHNDLLTIQSVKFFADGALGSRGAAMLRPYSDDSSNRGILFYEVDQLARAIRRAGNQGFQVNIHAIGDRANRTVIDAHEKVQSDLPADQRHRIEHVQIIHFDDIPRMRELDLIASIQPAHAMGDMGMAERRLGDSRMKGAYAWRRFLDEGVAIAGGSDFPIETPDPFYGMYTAVKRKNRAGNPSGGWYPEHQMSPLEALYAYTAGAAYAARQEHLMGTLETGKKADFILTDRDPLSTDPKEWLNLRILETWVGGRKVYTMD